LNKGKEYLAEKEYETKDGENKMSENKKWKYRIETVVVMFGNWQIDKLGEENWEAVDILR